MRRTLGTTVFSGMLGVTIFGIFLTPVFFYRHRLARRDPAFGSDIARGDVVLDIRSACPGVARILGSAGSSEGQPPRRTSTASTRR